MTSPVFSDALSLLESTVNSSVTTAQAAVSLAPPGAAQSGIDFSALGSASLDFLQVGGDAINVFAQDFQAVILETLAAATLASSIVSNIEEAITIGTSGAGAAHAAAPAAATLVAPSGAAVPAATVTVSSVLAQVQQQATTNLTLVNTVFQTATSAPLTDNLPSGNELQVLGGQILFQQDINAFLNSLPATLSPDNDSNTALIATMQNLLLIEQNLNNTLSQIATNSTYEQPISLTGLNVAVVLDDAAILTDVALAAITYAFFVYELLVGELVTVSAAGDYTVTIPTGATYVDLVLISGGGGGGGYDTPGSGTGGAGGNTTATPNGGSTLTAVGGAGGASSTSAGASAGGSPGIESFDGQIYLGGLGGGAGFSTAGGNGTAPGGGGGGGSSFGFGGAGGAAGIWAAETIAIPSGMTEITGSVGAGGTGGASSSSTEKGGTGGTGSAYFRFYSQAPS